MINDFKFKATRTDKVSETMPAGSSSWKVTITAPGGKTITRDYFMGPALTGEPKLMEVLESLIMDAEAVADRSVEDFMGDFGYEDYAEALKVYKACERTANRLGEILTALEYDVLVRTFNS